MLEGRAYERVSIGVGRSACHTSDSQIRTYFQRLGQLLSCRLLHLLLRSRPELLEVQVVHLRDFQLEPSSLWLNMEGHRERELLSYRMFALLRRSVLSQ